MKKVKSLIMCMVLILGSMLPVNTSSEVVSDNSKIPAFPGAEGYGAYTSGGRGGDVYEVTNLNDSGEGSLRDAVSKPGRTVIFRVSGTIDLKSQLKIQGNITIAGQTAPGDGICVKGYPTAIVGDNVIIRYMRFRLGDENGLKSDSMDINNRQNIIIDHCSFSWGVDETFSCYDNSNLTIQWCMITEGLNNTNHSCGGLWGPRSSYHHNLFAHNKTRNPKLAYLGDVVDFRNNVIYDWGEMSTYLGSQGKLNIVNNYYKPGPSTNSDVLKTIVDPDSSGTNNIYCQGNYMYGSPEVIADNIIGVTGPFIKADTPFPIPEVSTYSAEQAYQVVLAEAGASLPTRDAVDTRIVNDVINGTGSIILSQNQVGGYPVLNSAIPPEDSDHDGMPNEWEKARGLNPNDPSDRNGDLNGDGYTNLEEYLNSLTHNGQHKPVVNLTTPAVNTLYTAPASIVINADAFDVDGSIEKVEFYNGSKIIGEDTTAPYSFNWQNVPDGTYYLTAKAYDNTGLSEMSKAVQIHVNNKTETLPWVSLDVGTPGIQGSSTIIDNIFTVKGSGEIGSTSDSFHYLFQKLKDDGEIVAKVNYVTPLGNGAKAGIMIRNDLTPESKTVMLGVSDINIPSSARSSKITFGYRPETGSNMSASITDLSSLPCWLKLTRQNNLFTGFVSFDGSSWTQIGSQSLDMRPEVYIGFAVSADSNSRNIPNYNTAKFSDVQLSGTIVPVIFIDQSDTITKYPDFTISGTVNKRCKILTTVNGEELSKRMPDSNLHYNADIKLKEGENIITVQAYLTQVLVNGRVLAEVPSDARLKPVPEGTTVKKGINKIRLKSDEASGNPSEVYDMEINVDDEPANKIPPGHNKQIDEFPVEIRRVTSEQTITVILDTIPPILVSNTGDITVNKAAFTLSGSVSEKSIVKISLNNGPIIEVPTDTDLKYSADIKLVLGENNIAIQAVDPAGNISQITYVKVVLLDNTPPIIEYIGNYHLLQQDSLALNVYDDLSGLKDCTIKIGDEFVSLEGLAKLILPPSSCTVYVKVSDMAGNVNEASFTIKVDIYVDTLQNVINKGYSLGYVTGADVRDILINKANTILIDRYRAEGAIAKLNDFKTEVETQLAAQKLDAGFGKILLQDIQYLTGMYANSNASDAIYTKCLKFDFGSGPVANGYTQVLKTTVYDYVLGYGLFGGANIDMRNRSYSDDLRRDFVVGDNLEFRVDLPDGKYSIMLISGDKDASQAAFNVKAEGEVKLTGVSAQKGSYAEKTFEVTVADGQLNIEFVGKIVRVNALEIIPIQ